MATTSEPVPCCEFCLGEYLAEIEQQWRTPATARLENMDLCSMHWAWYNAFLKEARMAAGVTPSLAKRYSF